ncbi:MAG: hypothetical protein P8Z35_13415, partial [Ignavibacteriaceae bacterium]
ASLFTIPDKLTEVYGEKAGLISAVFVFVLVSPAPYLLMTANLISLIFGTGILISLILGLVLSIAYLLQGGFKANVFTDSFQFFVMFGGFILILFFAYRDYGGVTYLSSNLPPNHLKITGGASPTFIIVWFLIALWTFAEPGFHQRCYAAKSGNVAVKGILISIIFWALFDFLTTTTGLYSRAVLPGIQQPVQSYPLLAEKVLSPGLKGIFYAALFATIMSTLNSFLFLSGTIPSVIEIWYTIGSFCIPGIILPVISSYYPKFGINKKFIILEMLSASAGSILWFFIRENFLAANILNEIEPMLVGLTIAVLIHLYGMYKFKSV